MSYSELNPLSPLMPACSLTRPALLRVVGRQSEQRRTHPLERRLARRVGSTRRQDCPHSRRSAAVLHVPSCPVPLRILHAGHRHQGPSG